MSCYLVEGGWEHNTFKMYLASLLLLVMSTQARLQTLELKAENHVVNCVSAEADTQGMSFSPLGSGHCQVTHQNREVTLRHAMPVTKYKVWHFTLLQEPTGNSFI